MDYQQEQMAKAKAEQEHPAGKSCIRGAEVGGGLRVKTMTQTAESHPREILLRDVNDAEQRLLDKLAVLRALRQEFNGLSSYEALKVLNVNRLADRLRD